ncbi:MAG: MltA domain-containing protein [Elusimicrobiaceae bacterium]|nr:MltA domain-containing protein [Elusimicrobiaceae bacterium]
MMPFRISGQPLRLLPPLAAVSVLLFSAGCVTFKKPPETDSNNFARVLPADYPDFGDLDNRQALVSAARESLEYLDWKNAKNPKTLYTVGDRQITGFMLADTIRAFIDVYQQAATPEDLRRTIAEKFDLYRAIGSDGKGAVTFSAYYEPIYSASRVKTGDYIYPIYRKPSDLIEVDLERFDESLKSRKISGRVEDGKLVPYADRETIDLGHLLAGKNLEIAWFKSKIEIMDLHIEGSARLNLPDGTQVRAHYSGTNALEFKGWITTLVKTGVFDKQTVTREKAEKYLADHPEIKDWILASNKRYTFFTLDRINDPAQGPSGSIDRPLVAERSIAVDPKYFPLGALVLVQTAMPELNDRNQLLGYARKTRIVLCQDTGGAIKGPGRVDYFAGTGSKAGTFASNMWSTGEVYLPVLKFRP